MGKSQDGNIPGPQGHAEGQQGDKAHKAFIESLHSHEHGEGGNDADPAPHKRDFDEFGEPTPGRHRLREDRQQHDEAEKNSEANRERR